jgi:tRNA threonylcarbamoyladenosine biosynthesis protein TsaE
MKVQLQSEIDTVRQGQVLAATLRAGDVVALVGDLGAGKTHLTKGIVSGMGSIAEVTSPTFSLVHEYHGGRLPVYHFDLYRVEEARELWGIGWDDYLDGKGVCVVEWADLFPSALPIGTQWLKLTLQADGSRELAFLPPQHA